MIPPLYFPALYAETHYRFRYFFSYLYKREPEIIADVPHRLEPGQILPVLIIIKDADKFPVEITSLKVFVDKIQVRISTDVIVPEGSYFEEILEIDRSRIDSGLHMVDIQINYLCSGKTYSCFNDNYRSTGKESFPVYFAAQKWPTPKGYISGEVHAHTSFTSDQIEFAASPKVTAKMAQAMGMHYFCATDHSYDLDDFEDDYSKNDPQLGKWNRYLKVLSNLNSEMHGFCIIPGEEVSVRNHENRNIHLLVFNPKQFFPGSGDSGDSIKKNHSELSINDVINKLDDDSIAVAAHPIDRIPVLQKRFLNRSEWQIPDILDNNLNIIQMINSNSDPHIHLAIEFWKIFLLKGKRVLGMAGNDAHGNFARYRQIKLPFLLMKESYDQLFGFWRTVLFHPDDTISVSSIIKAFRNGQFYFSNGPGVCFSAELNGLSHGMGSQIESADSIHLKASSNKEFGRLKRVQIYQGIIGTNHENLLFEKKVFKNEYNSKIMLNKFDKDQNSYFRAAVISENERGIFRAFSNPVWISGNKE